MAVVPTSPYFIVNVFINIQTLNKSNALLVQGNASRVGCDVGFLFEDNIGYTKFAQISGEHGPGWATSADDDIGRFPSFRVLHCVCVCVLLLAMTTWV